MTSRLAARGCLAEDVVPDRVERAAVEELGAGARRLRGEPAEEAPRLRREHLLRPADGGGRVAVEVVDRERADHRQVVVAGEAERRIARSTSSQQRFGSGP